LSNFTPSGEEEARRQREELAHAQRVTTLGELGASLAHEINQPLAAIVTNAKRRSDCSTKRLRTPGRLRGTDRHRADAERASAIIGAFALCPARSTSPRPV